LIEQGEIKDLHELENGVREMLKEIGAQAYGKVLDQEDQKIGQRIACQCGAKARRISRREAKLMSVFGWVNYRRSYFVCEACGTNQIPLDCSWDINPGEVSPVMGKLMAIAGVDISFDKACRKIKEYLLVEVCDNTIRKQTCLMGQKQAQEEKRWIEQSQDEIWLQKRERHIKTVPERLYGSIDGAIVPIGKDWRELKSLCWYVVDDVYRKKRQKAQQISYHSDIVESKQFGQLLWATGVMRLADKAKELIFVCDGAAWIWKLVEHYFPQAVQIVDWYHACQYLVAVADRAFSCKATRSDWLDEVKNLMWNGQITEVIQACQNFLNDPLVSEPAHNAVTYFSNNQERMNYAHFREMGYWIGSGTIESACKQIASARIKISGARWTVQGAVDTAKARAAWLSDGNLFDSLSRLPLAS
jgi:hypothetical protein